MPTAAILGASGYAGQETLDRLLAHPELELLALGSDSLAGQAASALDVRLNGHLPAFVPNDEALAGRRGRRLRLPRATRRRRRSSLRTTPSSSTSPARTAWPTPASTREWYGFEHPQADVARGVELRGARAGAADRTADREPRAATRPRRCSRSARVADLLEPASVVVDAKSGVSGAGRALKESSHAGFVLENVSPYRVGTHQHAPEIEQVLGFPVCFVPHLLPVRRGLLVTCYAIADADEVRARLEDAYAGSRVVHLLPEGVAPELARVQETDAAELGVFEDRATGKAIVDLRARQPRQGRRGPGRAEREPRARPRGDGRASVAGGAGVSVTAAQGFVASGVHCGIRKTRNDLALVRSTAPATGAGMFTVNRMQAAPVVVSKRASRARAAAGGRRQLGERERGDRRAGRCATREATAAATARLLGLDARSSVLVLSTGVIGVPLPIDELLGGLAPRRRGALARRAGRRRRRRS